MRLMTAQPGEAGRHAFARSQRLDRHDSRASVRISVPRRKQTPCYQHAGRLRAARPPGRQAIGDLPASRDHRDHRPSGGPGAPRSGKARRRRCRDGRVRRCRDGRARRCRDDRERRCRDDRERRCRDGRERRCRDGRARRCRDGRARRCRDGGASCGAARRCRHDLDYHPATAVGHRRSSRRPSWRGAMPPVPGQRFPAMMRRRL